jgi:outer membrane murein-binding lipoprotein Lpp
MRLPKIPKGLASRVRKLEAKQAQLAKVKKRKAEILALRKKEQALKSKISKG